MKSYDTCDTKLSLALKHGLLNFGYFEGL